jgi:hypothetical protein
MKSLDGFKSKILSDENSDLNKKWSSFRAEKMN